MCRARTRDGARLEVDASDIVGSYIAYFGVWEPNLTSWLEGRLRPGDVFVDVGANVGYFTVLASRLVGESGRVVAVEPSPLANSVLRRNVSDNGGENVRVENVAVWDSSGEVVVFGASHRIVGGTTLDPAWAARWSLDTQVAVPAEPLSKLLSDDEVARAAVLKVDVEGSELQVLEGMEPLLPRLRDDVAIVLELEGDAVRIATEALGRYRIRSLRDRKRLLRRQLLDATHHNSPPAREPCREPRVAGRSDLRPAARSAGLIGHCSDCPAARRRRTSLSAASAGVMPSVSASAKSVRSVSPIPASRSSS